MSPSHANNFDALRIILAVLVILSHSFPLATGNENGEPLKIFTNGQASLGRLAVDGFFIISGYLITQSWLRKPKLGEFMKRRFLRIYPGFIVAAAVSLFLVGPFGSSVGTSALYQDDIYWQYLTDTVQLRYHDYPSPFADNPRHDVNGSLWSISYEFWCYIGVALMGVTGLMLWKRSVVSLLAVTIGISVAFVASGWTPAGALLGKIFGNPVFWARLLPVYLAGVAFYLFRDRIRYTNTGALLAAAGLALGAAVPYGWGIGFPLCGGYLLFWFAFHPRIRMQHAAKWGDSSYGIYLYSFPIQQLFIMLVGVAMGPWLLFLATTPLAVVAGYGSYHGVEKWFLKRPASRKS